MKKTFITLLSFLLIAFSASAQLLYKVTGGGLTNNPAVAMQMQQAMMLPQGETLDNYINAEQMTRLNAFLTQYMGADLNNPAMAQVKQMKPATLNTTLQVMLIIKEEGGFNPQEQFDTYFQQEAQKQNKFVGGFETLDYQMNVLYGATPQRHSCVWLTTLTTTSTLPNAPFKLTMRKT